MIGANLVRTSTKKNGHSTSLCETSESAVKKLKTNNLYFPLTFSDSPIASTHNETSVIPIQHDSFMVVKDANENKDTKFLKEKESPEKIEDKDKLINKALLTHPSTSLNEILNVNSKIDINEAFLLKFLSKEDISSSWFSKFIKVLEYRLNVSIDLSIEHLSPSTIAEQLVGPIKNNIYADVVTFFCWYYSVKLSYFLTMDQYVKMMKEEFKNNKKYSSAESLEAFAEELAQDLLSLVDQYIEKEINDNLKEKKINLSADLKEELCSSLTHNYFVEFNKSYEKIVESLKKSASPTSSAT